ncbi:hypothetical protein [Streptomyces sp. NPDC051567]|uniref:hypothetical protein n=1 Tax=Streptomyces sp. NPDC051567 TaxID=3365660 RepID=UPI0037A6392C
MTRALSDWQRAEVVEHQRAGLTERQEDALTEDQRAGLACLECRADLRTAYDAVVVGHFRTDQLFACRGRCALRRAGRSEGLGEAPMPLAVRIGRNDGWAW